MKLNEIMSPQKPMGVASTTYSPQNGKRWAADAVQHGFTVTKAGRGAYRALDAEGKITGEFDKQDGGMLAFDAQSDSTTYSPQDGKRWVADAQKHGFTVAKAGRGAYRALDAEGKITGEFDKQDGGMLAFDAPRL